MFLFLCYNAFMALSEGIKGEPVAKTEIGDVVEIYIPYKAYKNPATIYVKVPVDLDGMDLHQAVNKTIANYHKFKHYFAEDKSNDTSNPSNN